VCTEPEIDAECGTIDWAAAAMKREPKDTASHESLSTQSRTASQQPSRSQRHATAEDGCANERKERALCGSKKSCAHSRAACLISARDADSPVFPGMRRRQARRLNAGNQPIEVMVVELKKR
jgi:hypothetical protein